MNCRLSITTNTWSVADEDATAALNYTSTTSTAAATWKMCMTRRQQAVGEERASQPVSTTCAQRDHFGFYAAAALSHIGEHSIQHKTKLVKKKKMSHSATGQ